MDASTKMTIEHQCETTVRSFYSALDANRHDELAQLFTSDGRWNRLGKVVVGPNEIVDALLARHSSWVTVHLLTNLLVRVISPEAASSEQYVLIYRFEKGDGQPVPFPIGMPIGLSMHTDQLQKTEDGWKIREKDTRPIMMDSSKVTLHKSWPICPTGLRPKHSRQNRPA